MCFGEEKGLGMYVVRFGALELDITQMLSISLCSLINYYDKSDISIK